MIGGEAGGKISAIITEVASVYVWRIYQALLTRPMKAARVYSVDEETRAYLRSRIQRG